MSSKVKLALRLFIIAIAVVVITMVLKNEGSKSIKNENITVTPELTPPDGKPERIISLDEEQMVNEVYNRLKEVYDSNGLMYINFNNDASNAVPVVLRNTGEAYMEYGSDVRLYLNNGTAIVATNPIEILEEAIPLEVIKGMLESIKLGTGSIERIEDEKGNKAIKISMSDIGSIIKSYKYISEDYGWTVMTGLGIVESNEVKMQIYLYDKKTATDKGIGWVPFECECIVNVDGESYSYWWTIGAETLSKPFDIGAEIYKLGKDSDIDIWKDELTTVSNSVAGIINELSKNNSNGNNKNNTTNNISSDKEDDTLEELPKEDTDSENESEVDNN